MWSVITKIFTKNANGTQEQSGGDVDTQEKDPVAEEDPGEEDDDGAGEMDDTFVTKQAKQRASVKWLLAKAFNNKVPESLKEPFYRDHENQEHLKPQIVGALASAEMYCLALGNIYSDPNYHNLNHWSILQTLTRKGVYVPEPSDAQLTETTLIQTNPLRMSAHMAVIESIMILYAKEVVTPDRVLAAVQRFSHNRPPPATPENHEQGLYMWISHACEALRKRIEQDLEQNGENEKLKPPDLPRVRELKDLSDGVALAALISYYCPDELHWTDLKTPYIPNVQDSLHNLNLVQDFCNRCLPVSVFHIMPEDVTYMRDSMKQNTLVFLADLFNVIEIHPAKCVRYPGMERSNNDGFPPRNEHGVAHKRNLLQTVMTPIPDLRSGLDDPSTPTAFQVTRSTPTHAALRKTNSLQQSIASEMSEDSLLRRGSDDSSFVVHRGKNIPTLRSVVVQQQQQDPTLEPLVPGRLRANKEKQNCDSKADERGEVAAGRPSNWEENRKSTFAGRRSRRNSTTDDSQLTIENFGGSQDNLNFIGRNPDKEVGAHVGRKISAPSFPVAVDNPAVRSSLQDARGSIQLGYDDGTTEDHEVYRNKNGCGDEKRDLETEKYNKLKRQLSSDDISSRHHHHHHHHNLMHSSNKENLVAMTTKDAVDAEEEEVTTNRMSFAELNKQKIMSGDSIRGIQLVYMQHDKADDVPHKLKSTSNSSSGVTTNNNGNSNGGTNTSGGGGSGPEKKTSFAALPNTTTWQQQSSHNSQQMNDTNGGGDGDGPNTSAINAAQLNDVRLKLEEKRRLIESEKRRMELAMNKQRQKVGKAAFLQAVVKGRGNLLKTPTEQAESSSNSNSATGSESQSPTSEFAPSTAPPAKPQRPFTLQEISDDTCSVERKWLDEGQVYVETKRTPDLDNMDMEQYQQSIAQMNSSLNDIQTDIQRLASQQNQIQATQQQNLIAQQQKQIQALQQQQHYQNIQQQQQQQQQHHHQQHPQMYGAQIYQQPQQVYASPSLLQTSASAPHIPQSLYHHQQQQHIPHHHHQPQSRIHEQPQFFLHDQSSAAGHVTSPPTPPVVPQRRTWAQQQQPSTTPPLPLITQQQNAYHQHQHQQHQPEMRTWNKMQNTTSGFVLHDTPERYDTTRYQPDYRYIDNNTQAKYQQNGGSGGGGGDDHNPLHHSNSFTLSQQHLQHQQPYGGGSTSSHGSTPSASPQHRIIGSGSSSNVHRQISQLLDDSTKRSSTPVSLQQMVDTSPVRRSSSVTHAPIPAPSADDMEPQNISFIGNADDQLSEGLSRLNITSGSRTYRIPSPTRPLITRNSFQSPSSASSVIMERDTSPGPALSPPLAAEISSLDNDPTNKKGFYIQFDDDQPKRPKPPLRVKRMSPKKERSYAEMDNNVDSSSSSRINECSEISKMEKARQLERELDAERARQDDEDRRKYTMIEQERDRLRAKREASQEKTAAAAAAAAALIIDGDTNPDPDLAERMKKRILLASLQRKQEQEEAKAKKEQEAQARRDREKAKEEEKVRKKEEQAARRAAILEQYKLKKAMEEAEREGKTFDKSDLMGSLKPTPKMRPKAASRPRPKTIHIDSGSVEMAEGMLHPSRGKKGSTSNLTAANSMRRDYYRGSQESLADRSMSSGMLYRDSPDDSRGMSPCHSANQTLGRRSSYKTSRDPSPAQVRGRPKYSNYQNFKGRKSSSLMNLYGSSTDQDSSLAAYRYGDTDSGLGRATPPRRAPSPGMGGSMRHLPSPSASGPGSLPGLMSKARRMFDDGSSDISSTPSSMMDYTGPRLYKQPATKSNRGIMLNAVEYCVFPGVVNREAKRRVLEEINRSESKHFLILFRDAGCQFRALYSYCPDREEVTKLYGTGPKQVNDRMFDKFFKYNSGGKCFSQVHTKHLTVTIDAFTIHNSLWQGKKVNLPNKKDMALVI